MVLSRKELAGGGDPWGWDEVARAKLLETFSKPRAYANLNVAHFYSGSFSKSVRFLKENGYKVAYTIAAHDRKVSREEHEALGIPFNYPHLTEDYIWRQYIEGYRLADVIVCPSTVAAKTVREYGPEFAGKHIEVIPHGCDLPVAVKPLPKTFVVGYMGAYGADKGVRYLLEAWKRLDYKDGSMLVLAGKDSISPWVYQLVQRFGGGTVSLMGWVDDVSKFYDSVSLYVQPSATEGFGIEVVEAAAHGRMAACSEGAGAVDFTRVAGITCEARNVEDLCLAIHNFKMLPNKDAQGDLVRKTAAAGWTWGKVRERYQALWRGML